MARIDYLEARMMKHIKLPYNFFDFINGPPVSSFLNNNELAYIKRIILRYKNDAKYNMLNAFMKSKGFSRLSGGTNRVAYRFLDNTSFILKIAIDRIGMEANIAEVKNQKLLQPYCTKIFDITQDGLIASVERVQPITRKEEFQEVADDVFFVITTKIIGTTVADDIGKAYFKNWGIRNGFGAVLLDFPYIYKLDEEKIFCNGVNPETHIRCTGIIDYDDGFNHLVCTKCGKRFMALDLKDDNPINDIIINRGGNYPMKVSVTIGGKKVTAMASSDHIIETNSTIKHTGASMLKVSVSGISRSSSNPSEDKNNKKKSSSKLGDIIRKSDEPLNSSSMNIGTKNNTDMNGSKEDNPIDIIPVDEVAKNNDEIIVVKRDSASINNNEDIISKIEDTGVSRYPKTKSNKAGSSKKAGKSKK